MPLTSFKEGKEKNFKKTYSNLIIKKNNCKRKERLLYYIQPPEHECEKIKQLCVNQLLSDIVIMILI